MKKKKRTLTSFKLYCAEEYQHLAQWLRALNALLFVATIIFTVFFAFSQAREVHTLKHSIDATVHADDSISDQESPYLFPEVVSGNDKFNEQTPTIDYFTFAVIMIGGFAYSSFLFCLFKFGINHFEESYELQRLQKKTLYIKP